jgi:hypothetical protein
MHLSPHIWWVDFHLSWHRQIRSPRLVLSHNLSTSCKLHSVSAAYPILSALRPCLSLLLTIGSSSRPYLLDQLSSCASFIMRLLHTQTLELHEFFGTDIPPYAILSHTWGEGEVSFQELQSGDGKSKAGYDKIRGCCKIAAEDGFQYAWVDTCCIDKTSSAELSEAINSMYLWYRVSEVCYVYLADVPANLETKATKLAIQQSRWFTRGWTLQELIAPPNVIFYNAEWVEAGTKESLESLIFGITSIHVGVLRDANQMEDFSVAQKMSWASKRVTTRAEDIAYCLLGIFGVHMPLLYGEGYHAFIRLQEEIMKNTADHSIFAWVMNPRAKHWLTSTYLGEICPGLLAPAPGYFASSGKIVQSRSLAVVPFSVTNKGIHLQLPTMPTPLPRICLAILDCHELGDSAKHLGLYVERQSEKGDVFRRIHATQIGEAEKALIPKLEQEDIFVKQQRITTLLRAYENYRVSIKGLRKSEIVLRESIPQGWAHFGDIFLLPSYYKKFGAFRIYEDNSSNGFVVILKHTRNIESPGQTSLSVKVVEHIPDSTATHPQWNSLPEDTKLCLLCGILENNEPFERLPSQFAGRVYWQHPVRKWWISVIIRRGMVKDKRTETVYVNWHTPKVD